MDRIVKRDGRVVPFDRGKITMAVLQSAIAVGGRDREAAERITDEVLALLQAKGDRETYPTVEEVQDLVEKTLIENGHARTAKAYIVYRYEHALKRAGRHSMAYSSDAVPYRKLWQALSWGVDNGCVYLDDLRRIVADGKIEQLIGESEAFYQREIDNAVRTILDRIDEVRVVIIAGPSSSGKTTTTIKIGDALKEQGYNLTALNVDNYFFDLESHPQDARGDRDYETPQALDLNLIRDHLDRLLAGEKVTMPYYNFKTGHREGVTGDMQIGSKDIILIDSLHGMFEGMTGHLPEASKFKLYIETLAQLKGRDGRFIRWADVRMLRRMIRDVQFRNYNPRQTLTHWHFVRRSELRYIVARSKEAHVVVNSFMPYELAIMKSRLAHHFPGFVEEFRHDPDHEDALVRAIRVQELFDQILPCDDDSPVPKDSLIREFIGGSGYTY